MNTQSGFIGNRPDKKKGAGTKTLSTEKANGEDSFETVGEVTSPDPIISIRNCNVFYGDNQAINDVSLDVGRNEVISLIGLSTREMIRNWSADLSELCSGGFFCLAIINSACVLQYWIVRRGWCHRRCPRDPGVERKAEF